MDIYINYILKAIDRLTGPLKSASAAVDKAQKSTSSLSKAADVAAGMMMRDMVKGATDTISSALHAGASIEGLRKSFTGLKGDSEVSLESLKEATGGTVSEMKLLLAANKAMMMGIDPDFLPDMFATARTLGVAMGRDTSLAIDDISVGMGRLSKVVLDNLGIIVSAEEAYASYAAELGVEVSALTESQKAEAWRAEAMRKMTEKTGELGDITGGAVETQQRMTAAFDDFTVSLGAALGPLAGFAPIFDMLAPVIGTFIATLIGSGGLTTALTTMKTIGTGAISALNTSFLTSPIGIAIMAIVAAIALLWAAWETNFGGIRDFMENLGKALKPIWDAIVGGITWIWERIQGLGEVWKQVTDAIGAALKWIWDTFLKPIIEPWIKLLIAVWEGIQHLGKWWDDTMGKIGQWLKAAWDFMKPIWDAIHGAIEWIVNGIKWLADVFQKTFGWIIDAFKGIGKAIGDFLSGTQSGVEKGFRRSWWRDAMKAWVKDTREAATGVNQAFASIGMPGAPGMAEPDLRGIVNGAPTTRLVQTGPITIQMINPRLDLQNYREVAEANAALTIEKINEKARLLR